MTKSRNQSGRPWTTTILFGLVVALLLAACGGGDEGSASSVQSIDSPTTTEAEDTGDTGAENGDGGEQGFSVGVAFPGDAPYLDGYRKGLDQAAGERGVELSILNADWDAATQSEQIQQLASSAVDGLIVWPVDAQAVCTSIAATAEAGIPMVASNSQVDESCADQLVAYTGPDDIAQGCEAAKLMNSTLEEEGKVLVIEGVPGTAPQIRRLEGFEDCLADGIEILDSQPADWDKAKAISVTRDLLTRYGDEVDGIFGQDDTMAAGAAEAAQELGVLEEIAIVGLGGSQSGLDAVRDGLLTGTMIQSPVFDGIYAVNAIVDHLEGKDVEPVRYLPIPVVTQENVDEFEAEW